MTNSIANGIKKMEPRLEFVEQKPDMFHVKLSGGWTIYHQLPHPDIFRDTLDKRPSIRRVAFDTTELEKWDSRFIIYLIEILNYCDEKKVRTGQEGLPEGVQRLLILSHAVPEKKDVRSSKNQDNVFKAIGQSTEHWYYSMGDTMAFLGELASGFARLLMGRAQIQRSDVLMFMYENGAQALPIVSLISGLVGLIMAFVGSIQLVMFGAQIYVANLVGIAVVRVMGAIMAGIIMAGRTGAAFAAQIGTMEVNEEIDALKTLGISPMEFLVLPRILAMVLMMPLLCIWADLMGVLGGALVGVAMLDLNVMEYYNQTVAAVSLEDFVIGLIHSAVFGILVAISGCMRGLQCKRSAAAVGVAATSAVVSGIVAIIIATALITLLCNVLGI